jgi:predicted deacylase
VLKATRVDTEVYILDGAKPGGTVIILGGTHPNESAGHLAAVLPVERLKMDRGHVFIMPRANASGFTVTDPQEAS